MSWGPTLYAQLADDAAVLVLAEQLGIELLSDGSLSTGNHHFALVTIDAPWQTPPAIDGDGGSGSPGVPMPGLWFMGRINDEWAGAEAAMAMLEQSGVLRDLVTPPVVWAEESGT